MAVRRSELETDCASRLEFLWGWGMRSDAIFTVRIMQRLTAAFALILFTAISAPAAQLAVRPAIKVYKSPSCGCCSKWIEHLRVAGFTVTVEDRTDQELTDIETRNGVTPKLSSCHTALVDGYVVVGHVPADVIFRMLKVRPKIIGISVPGMPMGSPGMEGPNPRPYDVLAFDKQGNTRVYASR